MQNRNDISASEQKQSFFRTNSLMNKAYSITHILAIAVYCTYAYTTIPSELMRHKMSIFLLISTITKWSSTILAILHLFVQREFLCYIRLVTYVIDYGFGFYYLTIFAPINSANCDIFENSQTACNALQILTIITFIHFAIVCLGYLSFCIACWAAIGTDLFENNTQSVQSTQTTHLSQSAHLSHSAQLSESVSIQFSQYPQIPITETTDEQYKNTEYKENNIKDNNNENYEVMIHRDTTTKNEEIQQIQ
jgi:hypothetical protein